MRAVMALRRLKRSSGDIGDNRMSSDSYSIGRLRLCAMMRAPVALAAALSLFGNVPSLADAPSPPNDLEARLRTAGVEGWKRMEALAERIDYVFTADQYMEERDVQSGAYRVVRRLPTERRTYKRKGESILSETRKLAQAGDGKARAETAMAHGVNGDYSFALMRDGTSGDVFSLRYVGNDRRAEIQGMAMSDTIQYHLAGWPLYRWVEDSRFRVLEVTNVPRPGDAELVRVRFEYPPTVTEERHGPPVQGGILTFDPDLSWALTEFELRMGPPEKTSMARGSIAYAGSSKGMPRLREFRYSTEDPAAGVRSTGTTRYERYEHLDVPDAEFRLSAYGFPDPSAFEIHQRRWIGLVLILLGCLLAGVAWTLYRRARLRAA
jgi:hypothetical protein